MGQCQSCLQQNSNILGYKNFKHIGDQFSLKNLKHGPTIINNSNCNNQKSLNGNLNNGSQKASLDNQLNPEIPKLQITSPGQTNVSLDMNHLTEAELILESKYSDLTIPTNITLSNFLISEFKKIGDKEAIVDVSQQKSFSYPQLLTSARKVCAAILTHGLKQGDGVIILAPNCAEIIFTFVGVLGAGGILIFLNPNSDQKLIDTQLKQTTPKYVFTTVDLEAKFSKILRSCESIEEVILFNGETENTTNFDKFLQESDPAVIAHTKLSVEPKTDVAAIFYTRGGHPTPSHTPKAVLLSHHNILANLYQIRVMYDIHSNDNILNTISMHTAYGFIIAVLYSLIQGSSLHLMPHLDPLAFILCLEKCKISHIYATPETAEFFHSNPMIAKTDLTKLKELIFGTEQPNQPLIEAIRQKFKTLKDIRFSFSLTEFSPLSHVTPPKTTRVGSFGVLLPNTHCKIISVEGKELLGPMRKGQMCIKGPQVFIGYLNDDAETAKVLDSDGWFYTDDVVYYDKEMHFFYVSTVAEYLESKQNLQPQATNE